MYNTSYQSSYAGPRGSQSIYRCTKCGAERAIYKAHGQQSRKLEKHHCTCQRAYPQWALVKKNA